MAGGHRRMNIPRRYKMNFVVQDRTKKNKFIEISLDEDRFAEAVDFCRRFTEECAWWEIYDRHVKAVIANWKTYNRKGQDGQDRH